MDADELKEEIAHLRVLQKEYRKRIRVLEQQAAKFGMYVPPHIQIEIDEMKEKMQECENKVASYKNELTEPLHKELAMYTRIFPDLEIEVLSVALSCTLRY